MTKKFNIKDILSEESKSKTESFEIENIPIELIVPTPKNQYGIRDIEELAGSIEELGLLHNLVVKVADSNGLYEIVSGERRFRACKLLLEKGDEKFKYLPCKIENVSGDIFTELKMIHANAMTRILTDTEKIYQAGRINDILYKLKNEGYEFSGRIRTIVAGILDVSDAQVGRMIKMDKDLTNTIKEELNSGNINITTAYDLSLLDEQTQISVMEKIKNTEQTNPLIYKQLKSGHKISSPLKKDQQKIISLFKKNGIDFYNADKSVKNPFELGQDILKFLEILT